MIEIDGKEISVPPFLKTEAEIYAIAMEVLQNYPSLEALKSKSKVSVVGALIHAMAMTGYLVQNNLYKAYVQMNQGLHSQQVGSQQWYVEKTFEFQYGETPSYLGSGLYTYANLDPAKQIIKQVSVTGAMTNASQSPPAIYIRANKVNGAGEVIKLGDDEIIALQNYWYLIDILPRFTSIYNNVGDVIGSHVNSYNGDDIKLSLNVVLDPQLYIIESGKNILTGKEDVREYIQKFINNLSNNYFGGSINLSDLIKGVSDINGVIAMAFTLAMAKSDDVEDYTDILINPTQSYASYSGYFKPIPNANLLITYSK